MKYRNKIHKHFASETRRVLRKLATAGWKILWADDGGAEDDLFKTPTIEEAVDVLTSVDMSHVRVAKGGKAFTLLLVLGNGPGELVADWCGPLETEEGAELDKIVSENSDFFECKYPSYYKN